MGAGQWTLCIDFGTSFTTGALTVGERVDLLEIDHSRYLPSTVYMDFDGQLLVGRAALGEAAQFPDRAERLPKRALVRSSHVRLAGTTVSVVDLVAAVLRKVAEHATSQVGGSTPGRLRLTHPAGWTQTQLDLLMDAAATAALPTPELIPEPIGAAVWYAKETDLAEGAHVGVYDLGGGTFDTAVLRRTGDGFELAGPPGGNPDFGGEDLDEVLMGVVAGHAQAIDPEPWAELWAADDRRGRREQAQLRRDVTEAKESLSDRRVCHLDVPGYDHAVRITRGELEAAVIDGIGATVDEFRRTVERAGVAPSDLAGVFLAGGASRMPCVSDLLARELGLMPAANLDPKTVVVLGAMTAVRQPAAASPRVRPARREKQPAGRPTQDVTEAESAPVRRRSGRSKSKLEHPELLVPDVIDLAALDDVHYVLVRRNVRETEIVRIDPRTRQEVARAPASPTAWDFAASANGVVVSDGVSIGVYDAMLRKIGSWQPPSGNILGVTATSRYACAFAVANERNIYPRLSKGYQYDTSLVRLALNDGRIEDFRLGSDTYWTELSHYRGLQFIDARALDDAVGVIACSWETQLFSVIKRKQVHIVEDKGTAVRSVRAGTMSWTEPAADLKQVIRRGDRLFLAFHAAPGAQAVVRSCDVNSTDFGPSPSLQLLEKPWPYWIVPRVQDPFIVETSSDESVFWTLTRGKLIRTATVPGSISGTSRAMGGGGHQLSFEPDWIDDGNRTWMGFGDPLRLVCVEAGQVVQTIPLGDVAGLPGPLGSVRPISLVDGMLHCALNDGNGRMNLVAIPRGLP